MRSIILGFVLLLTITACQKQSFVPNHHKAAKLATQLQEIYDHGQLPAFAVAIVTKDSIPFQQAYGYAYVAQQLPYTLHTQQNIASLSKTFIGVVLMQAIEAEKLEMETPINDFLPFQVINPYAPEQPITVQHLATHTSGIKDGEIENRSIFLIDKLILSRSEVGKETQQTFTNWAKNSTEDLPAFLEAALTPNGAYFEKNRFSKNGAGAAYEYSNLGASLLAYIIELAMQQPFKDLVRQAIFEPLEMKNTQWSFENRTTNSQAKGYFQSGQQVPSYQSILYPSGGVHSTLHDLSLYLMAVLKNEADTPVLLSPSSFQLMTTPQLTAEQSPPSKTKNQGLMWEIDGNRIGHNGGNYGRSLFMAVDRKEQVACLFMTNVSSYQDGRLFPQMIEIWRLLWAEAQRLN
ncbi:MAG: serine hydrolase domain-containing protein [Bacteroidota bacterium]